MEKFDKAIEYCEVVVNSNDGYRKEHKQIPSVDNVVGATRITVGGFL